jgi:hypothetical protein
MSTPYQPGGAPIPRPRLSKLAVASLVLALVPCVVVVPVALFGLLLPVPGAGLAIGMLFCAPLALLVLLVQGIAWGLSSSGIRFIEKEGLRGAGLCWTARGIAGFQGTFACLQIGLCVLVPTLVLAAEAAAWRSVASRGVGAVERTVEEVAGLRSEVVNELQTMSGSLEKLSQSGQSLAQEVRTMNQNTAAMSDSLGNLARESAAWREEASALRSFDPWVWVRSTAARGWASLLKDLGIEPSAPVQASQTPG